MGRAHLELHRGILWLRGKPGSGKSTLMKHAMLRVKRVQLRPVVLSFFFNGRGNKLEKSQNGFYRTLLRQILLTSTQWPSQILQEFLRQQRSHTWYSGQLSAFLGLALLNHALQPTSSPIYIFIDALDEYDSRESFYETVRFLENLAQRILREAPLFSLNICVSRRDFPNLKEKPLEIQLERFNARDIRHYIEKTLVCPAKFQQESQNILIERAEGVFLWVDLVIKELNTTAYDPHTRKEVQDILKKYPRKLGKLYERAIRKLERRCFEDSQRLFQWILVDDHPFTPAELAYAMAFNHPFASLKECQDSDDFFGEDDFERRVVFLSCGLIQFSRSTKRKLHPFYASPVDPPSLWKHGRVQLIHDSVRSWLYKTQAQHLLELASPPRTIKFESWKQESRQVRKKACSNYLATPELARGIQWLETPHERRSRGWLERGDELCNRYILLSYAIASVHGSDFWPFRSYSVNLDQNQSGQIELQIPAHSAARIDRLGETPSVNLLQFLGMYVAAAAAGAATY